MEKITLTTLEDYKAFCESEKDKEKAFRKAHDASYYRAYKYFESHLNTCNFNILEGLIDDEEFLIFPLEIEILENPIAVEQPGIFAEFFEDPQAAFAYANKLYNVEGMRGIEVLGRGLSYEYDRDFCFTALSDENQKEIGEMLALIERDEFI